MYVLYSDGSVKPVLVHVADDIFLNTNELKEMIGEIAGVDMTGFIEEIENLGDNALCYRSAIIQFIKRKKPSKAVKQILMEALKENE
jgi:hypothetical protein